MSNTTKRKSPTSIPESYVVNLAEVKIPEVNPNQLRYSQDAWVKYGDNNLFPDYLMKSVKKSTRHSRFVQLRENMVKGAGLSYSDNLKPFLENLDEEAQTIEDLVEDVATDLSILETFAILVRYNKARTKIIYLDYVDSSKVRPYKVLDEMGKVQGYYICADWSNVQLNDPVYYPKFNPNKVTQTTQLFFYHKRANGQPFLPEISYASCLNYVEMEYETSKFGLNSMLNGFFASAILSVTASMSDEQKVGFKRSVMDTFSGSENTSKLMVVIDETADSVKVTPINTGDNTPMLKALSDMSEAAICTAHGGQPVLAGIQSQGSSLGSDGKLIKTSQELFQNNVIVHLQKPILAFLKRVFRFNGITEYDLKFETLNLVSEDIPEWFLMDYVKPEALAAMYNVPLKDLIKTTEAQPTQPQTPAPDQDQPLDNPYPGGIQ